MSAEAYLIPRTVKEIVTKSREREKQDGKVDLDALRCVPAWVLLGEPGAGKSTVFRQEAKNSGGEFIPASEFVHSEERPEWKGKCLFIDGLDEIQGRDEKVLYLIRNKLQHLGFPDFRIACRAADWFGESDRNVLVAASSSKELRVFALEPLCVEDVKTVLSAKIPEFQVNDFIEQANRNGIGALLFNPQTLNLVLEAIGPNAWPESRDKVYQVACSTLLREESRAHRDKSRFKISTDNGRLDAAGRIFLALLLSDSVGVALDCSAQDRAYPPIDDLYDGEGELVREVMDTRLFVPSFTREDRLEYAHRSAAEYLSATWMAKQLDVHGQHLGHALRLIQGFDGKSVGSMRGLYGWLACKSLKVRASLIEKDPLTVALYGDLQLINVIWKRKMLRAIRREILINSTPFWDLIWHLESHSNLGLLFHQDLVGDFVRGMRDGSRDQGSQCFAAFLLKVLTVATTPKSMPTELVAEARSVFLDSDRMSSVRTFALELLLNGNVSDAEAIDLLVQVNSRNQDGDEEFAGILLNRLCPTPLRCADALRFLHVPSDLALGGYRYFWAKKFPGIVPANDLPGVVDLLHGRSDIDELMDGNSSISELLQTLIARLITECGDGADDSLLLKWLRFGLGDPDHNMPESVFDPAIAKWFGERKERCKSVLVLSENEQPSLGGARKFRQGLNRWLNMLLNPPPLDITSAQQSIGVNAAMSKMGGSLKASHEFQDSLDQIRSGSAPAGIMEHLVKIWRGEYSDISGETPEERFRSYCDDYEGLYAASKSGLLACLVRPDLPTEKEIIDLHVQKRYHRIRPACLLGMDLLWNETPGIVETLDRPILMRLVCMKLTDGMDPTPDWFSRLAVVKPDIVAAVFVAYAEACFAHNLDYIDFIYPLDRKAEYEQLARLVVPALLHGYPVSCDSDRGNYLESLLWSALRYRMPELHEVISVKLKSKELTDRQRVYFLFAGALTNPSSCEKFYSFSSDSPGRAGYVGQFMGRYLSNFTEEIDLSLAMIGRIIELLAPGSDFDLLSGRPGFYTMTPAMERGEQVGALIRRLASIGSNECLKEINRLCENESLSVIRSQLLRSHHEVSQKLRDRKSRDLEASDVCRILQNKPPTNQEDLLSTTLSQIDEIASDIQNSNADLYRQFWNEGKVIRRKCENSCRDALLAMMRPRFMPLGIDCQPEFDYVRDKRADIHVSIPGGVSIPIEVKGQWHPELWESMEAQLARQYAGSSGRGIYVVLWFSNKTKTVYKDGKGRPRSAKDLEERLVCHLPEKYRKGIFVRVLDLSYHA